MCEKHYSLVWYILIYIISNYYSLNFSVDNIKNTFVCFEVSAFKTKCGNSWLKNYDLNARVIEAQNGYTYMYAQGMTWILHKAHKFRVQNCTFLVANATKNFVLATRISEFQFQINYAISRHDNCTTIALIFSQISAKKLDEDLDILWASKGDNVDLWKWSKDDFSTGFVPDYIDCKYFASLCFAAKEKFYLHFLVTTFFHLATEKKFWSPVAKKS